MALGDSNCSGADTALVQNDPKKYIRSTFRARAELARADTKQQFYIQTVARLWMTYLLGYFLVEKTTLLNREIHPFLILYFNYPPFAKTNGFRFIIIDE